MEPEIVSLVLEYLDIQSLGRMARTCKVNKAIVDENVLAWEAVFERKSGTKQIPGQWQSFSWRERVKLLTSVAEPFISAKIGAVFSFGVWRLCTTARGSTFIWTADRTLIIELAWGSNGWFRFRTEGKDWIVWSQGNKSLQGLQDGSFISLMSEYDDSRDPVPLIDGIKCTLPDDTWGAGNHTRLEVWPDSLDVRFPSESAELLRLPKDDASKAYFIRPSLFLNALPL